MKNALLATAVSAMLLSVSGIASAQAPLPPELSPTTQAAAYRFTMPPDVVKVTVNNRTVLCEKSDEALVRIELTRMTLTTRPTTLPSTLIDGLAAKRAALLKQMQADLGFTDPAPVNKTFDDLNNLLKKMDGLNPPLFYLYVSDAKLKKIMRDGWTDPHFYYNRVADDVQFRLNVDMQVDREMGDTVLEATYLTTDAPDQKRDRLSKRILSTEQSILSLVSGQSQSYMQSAFIKIIVEQCFVPMKLKADQEWFTVGAANVLATRYLTDLTGGDPTPLLRILGSQEDPRKNPITFAMVSLIAPTDQKTMQPNAIPYYGDTFRRKAISAVTQAMGTNSSEPTIRVIKAMKAAPPADGTALLKLIKEQTGKDLTGFAQ